MEALTDPELIGHGSRLVVAFGRMSGSRCHPRSMGAVCATENMQRALASACAFRSHQKEVRAVEAALGPIGTLANTTVGPGLLVTTSYIILSAAFRVGRVFVLKPSRENLCCHIPSTSALLASPFHSRAWRSMSPIRPCAEAILIAFCAGGVFLFWPFFENTWNRRFRREYRGGPPANASFDLIPAAVSTRGGWHPTSCNGEGEQYVQPPNARDSPRTRAPCFGAQFASSWASCSGRISRCWPVMPRMLRHRMRVLLVVPFLKIPNSDEPPPTLRWNGV